MRIFKGKSISKGKKKQKGATKTPKPATPPQLVDSKAEPPDYAIRTRKERNDGSAVKFIRATFRSKGRKHGGVWDGNRLAYPHRTGFRPVSDRFQTSARPVSSCRMHSPCHSPSSSPYTVHATMSFRMHRSVMSDAQCHSGCTALAECVTAV